MQVQSDGTIIESSEVCSIYGTNVDINKLRYRQAPGEDKSKLLEYIPDSLEEVVRLLEKAPVLVTDQNDSFSGWAFKQLLAKNVYSGKLFALRIDVAYGVNDHDDNPRASTDWGIAFYDEPDLFDFIDFDDEPDLAYKTWVRLLTTP
jgi:CRISPR/Cas system-associated protein Cas10 (large subunit of type III CRISPR-Cas system)